MEGNDPRDALPQAAYSPCAINHSDIGPGGHQCVAVIKTRYILRYLTDPNLLQSAQRHLNNPNVRSVCADPLSLMQYFHIEALSERSEDMIMTLNCGVCTAFSRSTCPF